MNRPRRPHRAGRSKRVTIITIAVALGTVAHATRAQEQDASRVQSGLDQAAELLQARKPREALLKLQSVESSEPDNPWLWFYRGLANLEIGNWYASMESLDRAQNLLTAYGDPDPNLAETIRRYRRKARSQVFGISLNLGLAYDGNVTFLGSGGAGLDIAGRGDGKFTSRLRFAYAPIANETESLSFGVRVSDSWHFSIEEFNDQDYGTTVRYVRSLDEHWSAAVQYDYDVSYLGNQPFASIHVLTPSLTYKWDPAATRLKPTETTVLYRIQASDYLFDTAAAFDRDGYTNGIAIQQSFTYQPDLQEAWTWDLSAGYSFENVATEGSEFDRLDHAFYLAVAVPLTNPWMPGKDLTLRLNANWEIADYLNDSLIDATGDERSDFLTTLNAVFSQKLTTAADPNDVTLHGIIGWTDANSNVTTRTATGGDASPFTYTKWIAGVQLEWSW